MKFPAICFSTKFLLFVHCMPLVLSIFAGYQDVFRTVRPSQPGVDCSNSLQDPDCVKIKFRS